MHILIATPTTNGIICADMVSSIVVATQVIQDLGGRYSYFSVDGADVVMARNLIAHRFLADPSTTHLLCLDSDMKIDRAVFENFFKADKPMIGAAYPERHMDLDQFARGMISHGQKERALADSLTFNVRLLAGRHKVVDHLCLADRLGFGCVLIERGVFENLISEEIVTPLVDKKLTKAAGGGVVYDFFGLVAQPDGALLSEDYSFCDRVMRLHEPELYAYIGPGIKHIGRFDFGAAYVEQLLARPKGGNPS